MSGFRPYRSFLPHQSELLLECATEFRVDNKLVPWEELISSDSLLTEIDATLVSRSTRLKPYWAHRTPREIRQELLRLHERWKKVEQSTRDKKFLDWLGDHPSSWVEESEDDDDIFMPSITAKKASASKDKRPASSKGKGAASSKGKSGPSTEAGGCVDGR